ncbi:MAG: TIR domain-containing protein [Cyanobacteria bacterium P01_G01_bin.38]
MPSSKIFISWSGDASRRVAEALRDWLPCIVDCPQLWMSSHDIPEGSRWANELATRLDMCNFGIIILTIENLTSPWIHFESGALSKDLLSGRVIPFLVGIEKSSLTGPLKQFQSLTAERAGTLRLVKAINSILPSPTPDAIFEKRYDAFWPEFATTLEDVISNVDLPKSPISVENLQKQLSETTEMLKEIVSAWNMPRVVEEQSRKSQSSLQEILPFEGIWVDTMENTHVCFRRVGKVFYAPYCFGGNNSLTGVFYDWKQLGHYWFAKFQWLRDSQMKGFVFLTPITEDKLSGAWWFDDAQKDVSSIAAEGINSHKDGQRIFLIRQRDEQFPEWANAYLEKLERQSPYENPLNIIV